MQEEKSKVQPFSLVKNCKTNEYPEENLKLTWDRLVTKQALKTAPSQLKWKKKFANSKLDSVEKHPDEQITEMESLRNDMDGIRRRCRIWIL